MTERFIGILTEVTGSHPVAAGLYSRLARLLEANDFKIETVIRSRRSRLPKLDKQTPEVRIHIPHATLRRTYIDFPDTLLMLRQTRLPGLQPQTIGKSGIVYLRKTFARYFSK